MASTTYLITGASRGLGLEYTRQLLALSPTNLVIAACRDPASSAGLRELVQLYPEGRLETVAMDVSDPESVQTAAALVSRLTCVEAGLDVLIHNAGVFAGGVSPFSTMQDADLLTNLQTNLLGPISVTRAFLPLMLLGNTSARTRKIFLVSSDMGSLSIASSAGGAEGLMGSSAGMSYAISKSAANMFALKLARELAEQGTGIAVIPFHPGWVKTDMNGGPEGPATLSVEEAVEMGLRSVILPSTLADSGKFMSFDGSVVPW